MAFHGLLHAHMPSAGHNPDFRARERQFLASPDAVEDAAARGIVQGATPAIDYWRVRAETFLDTFERHFQWKKSGPRSTM